jgi:hypothetical protein
LDITYGEAPHNPLPCIGDRSKYLELWEALATSPTEWLRIDAADAGTSSIDFRINNLSRSAFAKLGRRVQVVHEDSYFYIRIRPGQKEIVAPTKPVATVQKAKPVTLVKIAPVVIPPAPKSVSPPPAVVTPAVINPLIATIPAEINQLIYAPPIPPPPSPQPRPAIVAPQVALTPVSVPPTARRSAGRDPVALTTDVEAMLDRLLANPDPEQWDQVNLGSDLSFYSTFTAEIKHLAKRCVGRTLDVDREGPMLYCRLVLQPD